MTLVKFQAITFNAITIRIAYRSEEGLSLSQPSQRDVLQNRGTATIGSVQMRPIAITIRQDVIEHADQRSEDFLDVK